jgi:hypothetical protein
MCLSAKSVLTAHTVNSYLEHIFQGEVKDQLFPDDSPVEEPGLDECSLVSKGPLQVKGTGAPVNCKAFLPQITDAQAQRYGRAVTSYPAISAS